MRHDEIFTEILKNHGTNYKRYAVSQGKQINYHLIIIKGHEYIAPGAYMWRLADFGCRMYAVRGNETRDLTDIMMESSQKARLHDYIRLIQAVGFKMVVRDGDKEYELTSARIPEKRRKKNGEDGETE